MRAWRRRFWKAGTLDYRFAAHCRGQQGARRTALGRELRPHLMSTDIAETSGKLSAERAQVPLKTQIERETTKRLEGYYRTYYIDECMYYGIAMSLSVQSVRAKPEHREILQKVAALLRQDETAAELRRFLEDPHARPVGPFRNEEAALAFLRDRLVADLRPLSIWFFGSRARGQARPDSDFDLLVVLPDGLPEESYSHSAVAAPVIACGLACDIVPCSWSQFMVDKDNSTTLVHAAATKGREIYRARAERWISSTA